MTTRIRYPRRIWLSKPHMGELEEKFVAEAFRENWISTVGPQLNRFEAEFSEYSGLPSVAIASGTAGMHLGLKLLGVGDGDEVVCPTLTFAGGCNPILYERAVPVFVDSERRSWNLDPDLLAEFLEKRARGGRLPKAVIVAHLFGQCADMDPILEVCSRFDVPVLEDAAEALGSTYKGRIPGTMADVGVYSLNGNKIITGSTGGVLVAQEKERVDKARFWSTQARDPGTDYRHSELGYNYRMSNIVAAIARGQLKILETRVEQRRAVAFRYREAFAELPGIELMPQADYGRHTNWLSCFLVDESRFGISRDALIEALEVANVEARPVWKPMHAQVLYRGTEAVGGEVAEDLNRRGICLPSSSSLTDEEQTFIIERVREACLHRAGARRAD